MPDPNRAGRHDRRMEGAMAAIGYARVSTREDRQVLDRQRDALQAIPCARIFEDRMSGFQAERPGLTACLDYTCAPAMCWWCSTWTGSAAGRAT